jgi:hypothetical protein
MIGRATEITAKPISGFEEDIVFRMWVQIRWQDELDFTDNDTMRIYIKNFTFHYDNTLFVPAIVRKLIAFPVSALCVNRVRTQYHNRSIPIALGPFSEMVPGSQIPRRQL